MSNLLIMKDQQRHQTKLLNIAKDFQDWRLSKKKKNSRIPHHLLKQISILTKEYSKDEIQKVLGLTRKFWMTKSYIKIEKVKSTTLSSTSNWIEVVQDSKSRSVNQAQKVKISNRGGVQIEVELSVNDLASFCHQFFRGVL